MDFFSHQESARKRSRSLLWRFVLANLLLAGLLSFSLLLLGSARSETERHRRAAQQGSSDMEGMIPIILVLDCFMVLTVTGAALVKFRSLSATGGAVAEALGARKVSPETDDLLERRFVNVVEEMAIAANTPVPEIYILPEEGGINAFASGPSPEHSAVAVTRGALERLSRDELQGVVAHEFSHILHGDVRLNIRLAGYIYGLVILTAIGRFVLRIVSDSSSRRSSSSSKDKGGGAAVIAVIGLFFLLFGLLGRLVSVLMSAAISREREYLADATAVQLTRNPDGIAGALKKIGGFSKGATIESANAEGLSHFFLAEGKTAGFFERLYASHPPLLERIKRIDPNFDGALPDDEAIGVQVGDEAEGISQFASSGRRSAESRGLAEQSSHLPLHAEWLPPGSLRPAIVGMGTAEAVVSCVLLSDEPATREKQMDSLKGWVSPEEVVRHEAGVRALPLSQQVSAVFMALPTIQLGSKERRAAFRGAIIDVTRADGSVSLFEFLVSVLVYFGTEETDDGFTLRGKSSRRTLKGAAKATGNVLSVCALFAATEDEARKELFDGALALLGLKGEFNPDADKDIPFFLKSLEAIRTVSPKERARLIEALRQMVLADGVVTELEISLLRLFAVLLHTELPELPPAEQPANSRAEGA